MFVGNIFSIWAVVVAQLVEWSLPMSQVRGSNPIIGILLYQTFICLEEIEKKQRTNIFAIKVYVLFCSVACLCSHSLPSRSLPHLRSNNRHFKIRFIIASFSVLLYPYFDLYDLNSLTEWLLRNFNI